MAITIGIVLLVSLFILLFIGVPIAISIAIASFISMLFLFPFDVTIFTSAQQLLAGLNIFSLLAIPFFILAGVIMNNGGIALRLVNFAKILFGRIPGSLNHTNILGNMLFGSISGSAVASAAAIGGVMSPIQEKEGYDKNFSAAANIASAPTGMIIPPSIALIIFSLASGGVSIAALFIAGYIPGILWGVGTIIVSWILAKFNNYPVLGKSPFKTKLKLFFDAIPSLLMILVVIGGIVAGVFTATEASVVAVLLSLVLSFIYKSVKLTDIPRMLRESVEMTGVIMFLVAASTLLSLVLSFSGIPTAISNAVLSLSDNVIIILLLMNLILLLAGTFLDITPAVLIFTPIFLPIALEMGMDPIHFGIMIVFNLSIGMITPPVGTVLFVGSNVGGVSIESVFKPLLIFYLAIFIVLMLVTFIPQITLFLPQLLGL